MIFSRACEHGVRAVLYVASQSDGRPVRVRDIARALDIPSPSLAKVVQELVRHGPLTSHKGRGGGVSLARPADQVTLLEVVQAIEGQGLDRDCVLGVPGCSEDRLHCPLHEQWGRVRQHVLRMLSNPNIAQLAQRLRDETHVLTQHVGGPKRSRGHATRGA